PLRRYDLARGGVGGDHRDVVIVQPRDRADRDPRLVPAAGERIGRDEPDLPGDMTGVHEHDVAGTNGDILRRRGTVELVGTDGETGLEMIDTEMARDVEQHRAPDDA